MWNLRQLDSHKQRLVTGLLLLIPLLILVSMGPLWSLCIAVAIGSTLGLYEFQGLLFDERLPLPWQVINLSAGVLIPLSAFLWKTDGLHLALLLGIFAGFFYLLVRSPGDSAGLSRLASLTLGWLYIPYFLSYVLLFDSLVKGRAWLFYIVIVVVATDAGAYYCGKRCGRHKLYERVSPKKTMEGSLGGLAASIMLGTVYGILLLGKAPVPRLILLSAFLGALSQVGDLMESMIKRMTGKKDSGQILPGHGGILDRLDSLLFVFPTLWFYLRWLG
jgi:phosphatidate cytidylyltransferase